MCVRLSVENLSYKKESWINNRRQHKRHVGSEWQRGSLVETFIVFILQCTIMHNLVTRNNYFE